MDLDLTNFQDGRPPKWVSPRLGSIMNAHGGERSESISISERLAKDRIVFLAGEVNDESAMYVTSYLFHLEAADPDSPIYLYINSPGGSVTAGFAIYDAMEYVRCDVVTVCLGMGASMAAFLLACGAPGKRIALPHTTIMIHQPLYGYQGQATDMEIHVRQVLRIKETLNKRLSERTGRPFDEIRRDTERDHFLTAQEAKEYGLVDQVVAKRPQ